MNVSTFEKENLVLQNFLWLLSGATNSIAEFSENIGICWMIVATEREHDVYGFC